MALHPVSIPASPTTVDLDVDIRYCDRIAFVISNDGAVDIASVAVSISPSGHHFGVDSAAGAAIGTIAAGAKSALVVFAPLAASKLRLTFTSAGGATSATVDVSIGK